MKTTVLILILVHSFCAADQAARYEGHTADEWLAALKRQRDRTSFVADKISPRANPYTALVALGAEAVGGLEAELARHDDRQIVNILREIGRPAAEALAKALAPERDAAFRLEVLLALGQLGPEAAPAVPALMRSLSDTETEVAIGRQKVKLYNYAVRVLEQIKRPSKESMDVLVKALGEKDYPVMQRMGAVLLGRLGPDARRAVGTLTKAVDSGGEKLQTCAIQALGLIGGADAAKVLIARLETLPKHRAELIKALGETRQRSAMLALVAVVKRGPYRSVMGEALRKFGTQPVGLLLPMLGDKKRQVRESAAMALGDLGSLAGRAVGALRIALKDTHEGVRSMAAVALGKIGPAAAPAVDDLMGLIDEGNAAIGALGGIGPKAAAAVPALVRVLRDKRREWSDRDSAAQSLGRIGAPAAAAIEDLQAVIAEHPNPDSCVRTAAEEAIRRIDRARQQQP